MIYQPSTSRSEYYTYAYLRGDGTPTHNSRKNYTLNHFIERVKIYNQEQFNYDISTINIKE